MPPDERGDDEVTGVPSIGPASDGDDDRTRMPIRPIAKPAPAPSTVATNVVPTISDITRPRADEAGGAAADQVGALPPGYQLHEFMIEGTLGVGGFGIVYRARDQQLQRTVAIKEYMPSSLAVRRGDGSVGLRSDRHRDTFELGLRSFVNEAQLLAAFEHPALLKVYRFWEQHGSAYMVMPCYEGLTLRAWLKQQAQPPSEAWWRPRLLALADALAMMHRERCYHRDIAPDNILLVGPTLQPVLLDFGAARRVLGDATQSLTVILKPGYAPIEQYAESASLKQGAWTDVYALCAVLYASIAGTAPPAAVARIVNDEMASARVRGAGRYGEAFLAGIDAGLSVKPEARPQDMAALIQRLGLRGISAAAASLADPSRLQDADAAADLAPPDAGHTGGAVHPREGHAAVAGAAVAADAARGPAAANGASADTSGAVPGAAAAARASAKPAAAAGSDAGRSSAAPSAPSAPMRRLAAAGLAVLLLGAAAAWWLMRPPAAGTDGTAPPVALGTATPPAADANAAGAAATPPSPVTATPPAAPDPGAYTPVKVLEQIVALADPNITVQAGADRAQVVIGRDRLQFRLRANVAGHVYVYLVGTEGRRVELLFPNGIDADNRIAVNQELVLPRPAWRITASGPPGIDHLVALVSPTPLRVRETGASAPAGEALLAFDDTLARSLWQAGDGRRSAFIGEPECPAAPAPCERAYGASLLRIEEVNAARPGR